MKKSFVTVSAPGKLMLLGEHAVVYGKPCLVTAVDHRIRVRIEKNNRNFVRIDSPEVNVKNYNIEVSELGKVEYPKNIIFVLRAIELFFKKYRLSSGLSIKIRSEFSSLFGFGSSSAVTVCTIKALSVLFDVEVDNKSLFDMAYKTVLQIQGVGSGFDLAAAVWGGTLYFVAGGKKIIPVKVGKLPLVVGYTGTKADTATLVKQVAEFRNNNKKEVGKIFNLISQFVEKGTNLLKTSDFEQFGRLMTENQKLLVKLGVSTKKLDALILTANKAGAYGAKLSGAGGGDCMIALVNKKCKKKVENAITKAGGTVLRVKTGAEGVKII
jgi:mevalonate kinase